jgi:predicted exporter
MVRGLWQICPANPGAAGTLYPELEQAKTEGWLSGYRTIPLNSLARQQQDLSLLKNAAPTVTAALNNAG